MTQHHPPGEPPADALEDQLADLLVVDGPNAGQVWTYVGDVGGYMVADGSDATICVDLGAVIAHTGAEVVRPAEEES